jgi:hypothetical protein
MGVKPGGGTLSEPPPEFDFPPKGLDLLALQGRTYLRATS